MSQPRIKTGLGLDAHAFAENRTLILGGVLIPYEKGLMGHSDADVLCHAINWPAYRAYDASYCPGAGHRACAGEYQGNYDRAYGLYGTQGGHSGPGGMLIGKD